MTLLPRLLLAIAALCAATTGIAQTFPNKPIRLVVPFPPGGPMDNLGRAIGEKLGGALGQPVIVENKPGANTIIAADFVSKAAPDGHTLLIATDATYSINPLLYNRLPYNPQTDLAPIVAVAHLPEYLMVRSDLPASNLQEFIAYAKANPGKVSYGSFGIGSNAHLAGEAFKVATGVNLTHVPYKGAAEVIPAIISGQIDAVFTSPNQGIPFIRQGKLKALGTTAPKRMEQLPDVPTFEEQGVKNLETNVWFGLFAPGKTPAPVLQTLADHIDKIVSDPAFRSQRLTPFALEPAPTGRPYFQQVLKADVERYTRYVRAANVKLD
ncbi:tripartite tricarboxylate transporter substrate binding protein [Ramlibacter sp. AW1]|uniref:Tripartite tricarboxylate transporter substrate binding protein n=1 Tax=Ramlibacter aurantiacus TaxID=2801330 RepID=A0A937D484_9BURK|nr:tripartite tricarboxylate transporter substrate binding protein [Ramlibacter aurantiacus]MBL0421475.1 tripartite tricarboxylate transporter substrate binding protein [Ramlibacter aurantiacus]